MHNKYEIYLNNISDDAVERIVYEMDDYEAVYESLIRKPEFKIEKDNTESFYEAVKRSLHKFLRSRATSIPMLLNELKEWIETGNLLLIIYRLLICLVLYTRLFQ